MERNKGGKKEGGGRGNPEYMLTLKKKRKILRYQRMRERAKPEKAEDLGSTIYHGEGPNLPLFGVDYFF